MASIFISYRREDGIAYAGRLYDRLHAHFGGKHQVFMDLDTIQPGDDFIETIERTVASCHVLIAVIGKQWIAAVDEQGRARLQNPEDFVRLEIQTALDRKIRVIPALVGGARMPTAQDLPPELSPLARRNAFSIHDDSFAQSTSRLIESLERALAEAGPPGVPGGSPQPPASGAKSAPPGAAEPPKPRLSSTDARSAPRERVGMAIEALWSRWRPWALIGAALLAAVAVVAVYHSLVLRGPAPSAPSAKDQTPPSPKPDTRKADYAVAPEPKGGPAAAQLDSKPRKMNPADGLPYVYIPPGSFLMGCSPGDNDCDPDERPPKTVPIPSGFWLGQTEVTQAAWDKVMHGNPANPSRFRGDQLPVEQVDWNQASDYCKSFGGKLPSEEQWEYAARARSTGPLYGSLDVIAWYSGNSSATTHPVGLKPANALGLYDMLGNVWEWTSSDYPGGGKVVRGGSWLYVAGVVRASVRGRVEPTFRYDDLGFRCVGEFR